MAQEILEIRGGKPLTGSLKVAGAKNAALPLMITSLLSSEPVELSNIPNLFDISVLARLLETLGTKVDRQGNNIRLHTQKIISSEAGYSLVKALRASFWVLAPLLVRTGTAKVALPGGDILGNRGVDIHLEGLAALGADIKLEHGIVTATAVHGLKPATINLKFPSVGATHQLMMAAALIKGTTVLSGVAREPEILAVAELLSAMGADISGAGTECITISGCPEFKPVSQEVIGDRIEAGTYIFCALAAQQRIADCGEVQILGFNPKDLHSVLTLLQGHGANIEYLANGVKLLPGSKLTALRCRTAPFPGFPTDLQAPLCGLLAAIEGQSEIEETIYDGRFGHVAELQRMGIDISVEGKKIIIKGGGNISAAEVEGVDIRGAAALVVAGLIAQGVTSIHAPAHLRRGYEFIEKKLGDLGASVRAGVADQEDFAFAGC